MKSEIKSVKIHTKAIEKIVVHSALFGAKGFYKGSFHCVYGLLKGKGVKKEVRIEDAFLSIHNNDEFNPYFEPMPQDLLLPEINLEGIIGWYASLQNLSIFAVGIHHALQKPFQNHNKSSVCIAIKPGRFLEKKKIKEILEVYRLKDDLSDWDYGLTDKFEIIGDEKILFETIKSECEKIIDSGILKSQGQDGEMPKLNVTVNMNGEFAIRSTMSKKLGVEGILNNYLDTKNQSLLSPLEK